MSIVTAAPVSAPATLLDRVNPVTRIAAAVLLSLPLLITLDWVSGAVALGACLIGFLAVGYRPGFLLRRSWPVLAVAPIAAISMALYGRPGGQVYWHWGWIQISEQSLTLAVAVLVRVLALGVPSVVLFSAVDPTDMADGLAQVAKLPARFVLGSLAGIRLIGRLSDDWSSMHAARRARGLGDHGLLRRTATMAFAILVLAIRRGSKLATAMEARGFGHGQRTWARPSTVGRADVVLLVIAAAIIAMALTAAVLAGTFTFVVTT